ncbi:MAG TPA: IS66 family transposase [Psychromonas sp.]
MPQTPDELTQLHAMLAKLQQENQALESKLKIISAENITLKNKLELALAQLNLNRAKRFGVQTEKAAKGTFNEAEKHATASPAHHKKGRQALPEELTREVTTYALDEPVCDDCGHELHACGFEESEQVKIVPAHISVIKHRCTKYACRHCENTTTSSKIISASKPKQPIPGSIASPEALAAVVTSKYCDALPLNRQTDILKRVGFDISRSTLANWCIKAAELVAPVIDLYQQHLLLEHVVCADETTVQVLDEPDRKAQQKSYMWVYRSGQFAPHPLVIYDYQPGRGHEYPAAFLSGYTGYLQCDGYSAYGCLENITLSGCWAHARRKFNEALIAQPKKTGKVNVAISTIQKLYAIEKRTKLLSAKERQKIRESESIPILDKFKIWLDETAQPLLPKSYLGIAVSYTLNNWQALTRYVENGELGIDNNVTERDIRPFTTGRKNWMFAQSVKGAEASAILYSIVMTCRAHDINPYFYFQKLFEALPNREEGADLSDLLPWDTQFKP